MPRKNKKPVAEDQQPFVDANEPENANVAFNESNGAVDDGSQKPFPPRVSTQAVERISFKIVDGKLDFDSLQARTLEKAREVLKNSFSDPRTLAFAGLAGDGQIASAFAGTEVTPVDAAYLLDFESSLLTAALGLKFKLSLPETRAIVQWSRDEHAILDERTARVLTKYLPEELKKSLDWALLLGQLFSMTMIKFSQVRMLAERKKEIAAQQSTAEPLIEQNKKPAINSPVNVSASTDEGEAIQ